MFTNNQFIQKQNINNKLISNDNLIFSLKFCLKFNSIITILSHRLP